ncbi:hypothetical protein [Spirulina subsalsa]|uniref:hypothetical protein n=1 Tax=Spirulina subsalsa TaxID=54311 RepID=UPI000312999E|nr:hypothetical protein [Spirulina subsalsa]
MFQLLAPFVHVIQPFLIPLCFLFAWLFILSLISSIVGSVQEVLARSQTMHQIPCTNCQFFTNDHRLKCTIHPTIANTEQAIYCRDFQPEKSFSSLS